MQVDELTIVWRMMLQLAAGLSAFWLAVALWAYERGLRIGYERGWKDAINEIYREEVEMDEVS